MEHELHDEVEIEAPVESVWETLIDLTGYALWNPFIVSASGVVEVGQRLENTMRPPGGRAMTFRPVVTEVDPQRTLEWLGRLGVPGLFDGRHRFELRSTADGTVLTQREWLSGLLVRPLRRSLDTNTLDGFHAMNQALKVQVERKVDVELTS